MLSPVMLLRNQTLSFTMPSPTFSSTVLTTIPPALRGLRITWRLIRGAHCVMLAAIVAVQRLSCFESSAVIREVVLHTQVIYDSAYV